MNIMELFELESNLSRENYVSLIHRIQLSPGIKSRDEVAISGFNGYLFLYNGANGWEKQLLGEYSTGNFPIQNYIESLERIKSWSEEASCEVLHLIIPEKQLVLPGLRFGPKFDAQRFGSRPFVKFQSLLTKKFENFVYPLDALKLASSEAEVFYRTNSHLSVSGVLVVFRELIHRIVELLNLPSIDIDDLLTRADFELKWIEHDLIVKYADNFTLDKIVTLRSPIYADYIRPAEGNLGTRFTIHNDHAVLQMKAYVVGDSYAYDCGISYLLSRVFREVHFHWTDTIDRATIQSISPDVLIFESAERRWFSLRARLEPNT